ncbi:MAG: hypothetical protein ABI358_09045 [Ginsengibacter sp.]
MMRIKRFVGVSVFQKYYALVASHGAKYEAEGLFGLLVPVLQLSI